MHWTELLHFFSFLYTLHFSSSTDSCFSLNFSLFFLLLPHHTNRNEVPFKFSISVLLQVLGSTYSTVHLHPKSWTHNFVLSYIRTLAEGSHQSASHFKSICRWKAKPIIMVNDEWVQLISILWETKPNQGIHLGIFPQTTVHFRGCFLANLWFNFGAEMWVRGTG